MTSAELSITRRLIAIRHGPPATPDNRCLGATDWQVKPADLQQQSQLVAPTLPLWPIISSPLQRCHGLAEQLSAWMARPLRVDARIRELDFGRWEGQPWDDIDRTALDRWSNNLIDFREHDGESFAQLVQRIRLALFDCGEASIWVTHAGVIRALHHLLGGLTPSRAAAIKVDYLRPYEFDITATTPDQERW